jgi:hypothetical protein
MVRQGKKALNGTMLTVSPTPVFSASVLKRLRQFASIGHNENASYLDTMSCIKFDKRCDAACFVRFRVYKDDQEIKQ